MIVNENDRGGGEFECAFDHFTRINRRMVDRARLLHLVGDQRVALVEKEDAELFLGLVGHCSMAIINDGAPGGEKVLLPKRALQGAVTDGGDQLEIEGNGLADTVYLLQQPDRCAENAGKRSETTDERLGDRLGILAWDQPKQQHFQDFVVRKRRVTVLAIARPQPIAMAVIMRFRRRRLLRRSSPVQLQLRKKRPFVRR